MSLFSEVQVFGRFAMGLPGFLRHKITLEEAHSMIRRRMAEREENFLRIVSRGIFGYPKSPYLSLMKFAGCEMGDIETMVQKKGLEKTLVVLRESGIYITFEEFRGREPVVRGGKTFFFRHHDFDNPCLRPAYYSKSSGSTGERLRIPIDFNYLAALAPCLMLSHEAHGTLNLPNAFWLGIPHDTTGLNAVLKRLRCGHMPQKWFSPFSAQNLRPKFKNALAMQAIVIISRLCGAPIPKPEFVRLNQAIRIARWMEKMLKEHGACLVNTHVSNAVRICAAAKEESLDLTGAVIKGGGEPPTPAKIREISGVGARWFPGYFMAEIGDVGQGCSNPVDHNDTHHFKDVTALIQYRRKVPGSDISVDAFHFTSLLPTTPKIMLNVESDDYGIIENRKCGCLLESYGYTEHIREIRSFRKLTGEGMTLIGSEMLHILEKVLPSRYGGTPLDYQLLEEEDEKGFTRLSLLVSPGIRLDDEKALINTVYKALRRSSTAADTSVAVWAQAGTLRVKRMDPISTPGGKLMPLHIKKQELSS